MGRPSQLTKKQVEEIKKLNDANPIYCEKIEIKDDKLFTKDLDIRENDVFLLTFTKL
jgi:xylan 1,4-beta-xylosidase